jgi:polygalacturonase
MYRPFFWTFALALCLSLFCFAPAVAAKDFNVRDYGALGDGTNLDTSAVQKALDACTSANGGTVVVPAGNYLIGSVVMGGKTTLRLESGANLTGSTNIADYPLTQVRYEGEFGAGHRALISVENANDAAITGSGSITGPPMAISQLRNPRGPVLIELAGCTNVTLDGFTTHYQRLWSIHTLFCQDVTIRNLTIRSTSVNGDGIDVDSSRNILIEGCDINTGDDAISLKSGRGENAVRLNRPTENVTIRNCTLVSRSFAGLGIGTELSGGIFNTLVEDCTLSGHQNGIFLKSRNGRGGCIKNFTGVNLTIHDSPTFLNIDLLDKGIAGTEPITNAPDAWTQLSGISFKHIHVDNVSYLVKANGIPAERPIDGFLLADVQGTCGKAMNMANMKNVALSGIKVTKYQGPLLMENNLEGTGITDLNPVPDP